ncbi:hypothetical protein DSO57_1029720 [Entomophthora muscae]|uniref:Uncharacterized protein n=1 Tax=Entomophthora muscae TaxID=34485 RepID=A0ACC2TNC4_9FUNG|nr:hypothetical protein DSO57_1029720 [Entomophthora muscae]
MVTNHIVFDEYYLGITAMVTVGIQLLFFLVAYFLQFDKVTDFAGTTNFIVLALLGFLLTGTYESRMIATTTCTIVWGIRIAGYLLYRILKTERDTRFDEIRGNFFRFLSFWVFQMMWVWVVSLPTTLTNSLGIRSLETFGNASDMLGVIIFIFGFIIETVSDIQKFKFNSNRSNSLDVMNVGLWYYSRHPNYFGEILVWWGIFIISLGADAQKRLIWLGILSPIFTMFLLLFLSGIPQSEPQKDKKIIENGNLDQKDAYFDYIRSTSPIIMMPPRIYGALPNFIKTLFFFEYPFYRFKETQSSLLSRVA